MTEVLLFTLAMLVLAGPANTFDIQAALHGCVAHVDREHDVS